MMTRIKDIMILPKIGCALLAALCCSCTAEVVQKPADSFSLKGVYESALTKSTPFTEGDAYHIFAYNSSDIEADSFTDPYIDSPASETSGAIAFPPGIETLFAGRTLDFFGVTLGESGELESLISYDGSERPVFSLEREAGRLKDLRRVKLQNMSSVNSGNIILPFRHTLSRLNFTITRQAVDQLVGATLESVSVWDYPQASYDILSGEWNDTTDVARTQMEVFSGSKDIYTDEELKLEMNKGKDRVTQGCLIFPREVASGSLHVRVAVRVPNSEDSGVITNGNLLVVESDLDLSKIPGGRGLQQNYEYTFSLAVINDNIKIIMVVPAMYDWIDGDTGIDGTIALGQPINFGGVTWADRNLGAESATYNNVQEWDQMRGYFFQYGRSIPYFVMPTNKKNIGGMDMEYVFTPTYSKNSATTYNPYLAGFPLINSTSKQDAIDAVTAFAGTATYPGGKWQRSTVGSTTYYYTGNWASLGARYPLGYHTSNSVSNLAYEAHEWELSSWDMVSETEKQRYLHVVGGADDDTPWWKGSTGSITNAPDTWSDKEKNPCPKGWKIPGRDDWAGIMPLSKRTGDITFINYSGGSSYTADEGINSYYDYIDGSGNTQHQFYCMTGTGSNDINQTYVYHNANYKTKWHKTEWFDAGCQRIDPDDTEDRLWWHEVGGRFAINFKNLKEDLGDPSPGYISHYLCIENKHNPEAFDNIKSSLASSRFTQGTLYAIKCQGTPQAYRLRWRYLVLTGSNYAAVAYRDSDKYPVVLEICRYPASDDEVLECPDDLKQWDDWENPTETIVFPVGGYIFSEAPIMTNNALESVYAAADHDNDGYFYYVRLKHSTNASSRYLMLFRMRRSYGMSVRCVKDNTVTID